MGKDQVQMVGRVLRPVCGQHRCPRRGCTHAVPDHLFACIGDWYALPPAVRSGISRTARLGLLAEPRRRAIAAARAAWDELDAGPPPEPAPRRGRGVCSGWADEEDYGPRYEG